MKYTDDMSGFTEWLLKHRPEVQLFLGQIEGQEMDRLTFIAKFKALGLTRSSPAKCGQYFDFLTKVGFIRSNNQ